MIDLTPACTRFAGLLGTVPADRFGDRTPCADYPVADLIEHVVGAAVLFASAAEHGTATGCEERVTDRPDWVAEAGRRLAALGAAWSGPSAWGGTARLGDLELPNTVWGHIALTELVVHGWDLAVAVGLPFELPEPTLLACWEHVSEFIADAPLPELWGPPRTVPGNAPLLDRIVATTGRDPHWSPTPVPH
jgi:uncharacterized protein (TIGR03086 family)